MKNAIVKLLRTLALGAVPCLFVMASCEEELVGAEPHNSPVHNFELFWKTFDTHYGLFAVKDVDWQEVYQQFRPLVDDDMPDASLYKVMTDMMVLLNDNHLNLYPTNGELPVFPGGVLRYRNGELTVLKVQEDYSADVAGKYVTDVSEISPNMRYGKLRSDIGYISLSGTDSYAMTRKGMAKVLDELRDTRGIVLDLRGHYGGLDAVSQYIAGCFVTASRLYMTTRKRNGPAHDAFTPETRWYVEPSGDFQFTRPVVVLTSRFTQSAGETLALAMNELDHVTLMGDTTAGSFSDNPSFELYNGWIFSVSVGDYRAADGKSFEGIGIAPDVISVTTKEELMSGRDSALEKATEFLLK